MDQGEEIFFKMFKESPMYGSQIEEQMREFWEKIRTPTAKDGTLSTYSRGVPVHLKKWLFLF